MSTCARRERIERDDMREDLCRTGRPDIVRRGEDNVAAKLTAAQVLEMRALAATGAYTKSELAQRYPVDATSVVYAVTGRTWGHLPGAVFPPWRRYSPPKGRVRQGGLGFRQRQILLMAYDRAQGGSDVLLQRDIFKELYGWTMTPSTWGEWFNPVEIGIAAYRRATERSPSRSRPCASVDCLSAGNAAGTSCSPPRGPDRRKRRWPSTRSRAVEVATGQPSRLQAGSHKPCGHSTTGSALPRSGNWTTLSPTARTCWRRCRLGCGLCTTPMTSPQARSLKRLPARCGGGAHGEWGAVRHGGCAAAAASA